jgi:hypothetical protein
MGAMSVVRVEASQYRVVCDRCRRDAFVCPKRQDSLDVIKMSVNAFVRAGWHYDPPRLRQPKQREAAEEMGEGTWYCPACAAGRP